MPIDLSELRSQRVADLVAAARELGVDNAAGLKKQELVFEIVRRRAGAGGGARGSGVLETLSDGFGFLRSLETSFLPGPDDIYVSPSQIRRFNLRTGDLVQGAVRAPKEGERYFALIKIESINERPPEVERDKPIIDNLSPERAHRAFDLARGPADPHRVIDALAPLALGQRIAILGAAGSGRTALVRQIVLALRDNHPEVVVIPVLVDDRPEEIAELEAELGAGLLSTHIEEPPARHVQVVEMALERARRIAEQNRDVVLLIDSLSRFARAANATATGSGRLLHGVVDPLALHRSRRILAAGRALAEGGSLTVIATCAVESDSKVDEALIEELGGVTNATLRLDSGLRAGGFAPALVVSQSRSDRPLEPAAAMTAASLRAALSQDDRADLARLSAPLQARPDGAGAADPLDKQP